jgi:HD-GYP domain-containing protein (c-di-GMP phosphodiesterase class II)
MLQSLAGKLTRITDLHEIGLTVADELRSLIDYHNCRVFVVEGDMVVPIAFRGDLAAPPSTSTDVLKVPVGHGVTGHVVQTGEPLLVGDAARCEFAEVIPGTDPIDESLLAVALRYGARSIGAIVISKLGFDQFDDDDLRLVQVLAAQASVAVENARLYEAQRREAESAQALLSVARELASGNGLVDILQRTVDLTGGIVDSDQTSLWLEDTVTGELVPRAFAAGDETRADLDADARRLLDEVGAGGVPFQLDDGSDGDARRPRLVAPFALPDGTRGCIVARVAVRATESPARPLALLDGLAHQAKLAIANASNFESLEGTFISTIEALANALEANDHDTSTHARWIADTALQVGRRLGLEGEALRRLELAALFHDIGKIGIPSEIISKPGKLTREERLLIEQHPELGERIIGPIARLEDVRVVVRHCHERFDGRGYPDGLVGLAIPVESRIVFVCDAFHAMTTDRPYRRALPPDEARRRLEAEAGHQFDPLVVETFLGLLDEQAARASAA